MTDIQLPSSITTIKDRDCFLNRFMQDIWAFAISKGAEYILFAQGCFASPSEAIKLRCDAQRQQAHNIDIINQGQITLPLLQRYSEKLAVYLRAPRRSSTQNRLHRSPPAHPSKLQTPPTPRSNQERDRAGYD